VTDRWTDRQTDTQRPAVASVVRVKIAVRMNATDVTCSCATVQYMLIMLTCGSQKMEFRHDGKLNYGWFGSVIGKLKPNCRPLV